MWYIPITPGVFELEENVNCEANRREEQAKGEKAGKTKWNIGCLFLFYANSQSWQKSFKKGIEDVFILRKQD